MSAFLTFFYLENPSIIINKFVLYTCCQSTSICSNSIKCVIPSIESFFVHFITYFVSSSWHDNLPTICLQNICNRKLYYLRRWHNHLPTTIQKRNLICWSQFPNLNPVLFNVFNTNREYFSQI